MAISRFSTSSVAQGLPKYQKLWDGISSIPSTDYELITRTTLGAYTDTVLFSSIPQTYKHLQVRLTTPGTGAWWLVTRINGNTSSANYTSRGSYTNGSTVSSMNFGTGTTGFTYTALIEGDGLLSAIIDYVDYSSTSKNKNIRCLWGSDRNGAGNAGFHVGSFYQAGAVNEIGIYGSFNANATFALYGIKGMS